MALEVESGVVLRRNLLDSLWRLLMLGATALVFFWWGQHFLLGGRVGWGSLFPGALATVVALGGLRLFSAVVFDPMIVSNAEAYDTVGVILVVVSWLIGVGFIFYGGPLVGRCYDQRRHEDRPVPEAPRADA